MADENKADSADSATAAIPHFCPACGAIMTRGLVDGVLCWICPDPDCGYIEPV